MEFFLKTLAWLMIADGAFGLCMARPVSAWLQDRDPGKEDAAPPVRPGLIRIVGGMEFAAGFLWLYYLMSQGK